MKVRSLRGRALRAVVGGLLMSSLSDVEIKKLAGELDFQFIDELRDMLMSLPLRSEVYQADLYDQPVESDLVGLIQDRAKSKRLSKDRVVGYMRDIEPAVVDVISKNNVSLRALIEQFVLRVGPDGGSRLLGRVSGGIEQDPYLQGISERR